MLQFNRVFRNTAYICTRFCSNNVSESLKSEKWDIFSSVSLERKPVVSRELNELEKKFQKFLLDVEFERSHKSNFELRREADKKRAQEIKGGKINISDMDSLPQQTGQDFLDASIEELKSFNFASRINDATIENDTKSLDRALDRYLILIVNEKIGQNQQWVLPQGKHIPGETLRESAERILKEKCGDDIKAQFMGNAPFGFYKYRYPTSVRTGDCVGAKIFFYKAKILNGQVKLPKAKCTDFMWATRSELNLLQSDYLKSVRMFLIDEEH